MSVNDALHREDTGSGDSCGSYREEESLRGTWLEQLLPLLSIADRESDWVDVVLELGGDEAGPLFEL